MIGCSASFFSEKKYGPHVTMCQLESRVTTADEATKLKVTNATNGDFVAQSVFRNSEK